MNLRILIMGGLLLAMLSDSGFAARQRISLAPDANEFSEADIEKEIIFGREMAAILLAERQISSDTQLNRYLNLVGQSIARQANRPELNFYFAAVESDKINAYAAPGGYIFVTTAVLDLIQNEAELAGVLAHEIAHVTDRHIVKSLNIREDDDSIAAAISKVITVSTESTGIVLSQAIKHAIEILFSKGLRMQDEFDADVQALYLTSLAGYDASAYYQLLERIKPLVEASQGELDSTHPGFSERLERLREIIEQEGISQLGAYKNEKRYRAHMPREG